MFCSKSRVIQKSARLVILRSPWKAGGVWLCHKVLAVLWSVWGPWSTFGVRIRTGLSHFEGLAVELMKLRRLCFGLNKGGIGLCFSFSSFAKSTESILSLDHAGDEWKINMQNAHQGKQNKQFWRQKKNLLMNGKSAFNKGLWNMMTVFELVKCTGNNFFLAGNCVTFWMLLLTSQLFLFTWAS